MGLVGNHEEIQPWNRLTYASKQVVLCLVLASLLELHPTRFPSNHEQIEYTDYNTATYHVIFCRIDTLEDFGIGHRLEVRALYLTLEHLDRLLAIMMPLPFLRGHRTRLTVQR